MQPFVDLPAGARLRLCEEAQARLGLHAVAIEKDFWVCYTLRELFSLPDWGEHLTFKGGTSLSKAWHLIDRFSEDIDIVIEREFLGFGGDCGPERAPSLTQQRKRIKKVKATCRARIQEVLLPALAARFKSLIPEQASWKLEPDESDPDGENLLFHYPAVVGRAAYVGPVVKIEMGARSDTEPREAVQIQPYLAEAFPEILTGSAFPVRAVSARRTFWEKAMLLHEEILRPPDKPRKPTLARHYYDLCRLIQKGVAAEAVADAGLFQRVAAHRAIFFEQSWMDYSTLTRGSLRLVPPDEQVPAWRQDYRTMQAEMFFGEVPSFEEVLRVVAEFEAQFNQGPPETV